MPSDGGVPQNWIHTLLVRGHSGALEALHVFADTHHLSRHSELRLDGIERRDGGGGVALAVEVEGEEAGDILNQTEELVTADCGNKH